MRIKRLFFAIMTSGAAAVLVMGCGQKSTTLREESISKSLNIAVFEAKEADGVVTPVKSALLQESILLDRVIHYDGDGDFVTVPFHFKDSIEYANITEANIGRRIVIAAEGEVMATPMVKMRIGNGACSFQLSKEQARELFSQEAIDKLLSGRN